MDHAMNFDTCSWLRRQPNVVELILNCHFVLIKTSQDVSPGPSEILRASILTGTCYGAFFQ